MLPRIRTLLALTLLHFTMPGAPLQAQPANPLPEGTIRIIVPLAAGGLVDTTARIIASELAPRISRTIVIENKPGAAGNIGSAYAAAAAPDGLTWLFTFDSVFTINPFMYANQGFDSAADFVPITPAGTVALVLAVNAKTIPAKSWPDLVALSQKKPLTFSSAGIGSPAHLAFEYLKSVSDLKGTHVPYRGAGPAVQGIVAGDVDAGFIAAGSILPFVASGVLRPLAVSSNIRDPALPDVPTAAEAGIKNFDASFSNILFVPAGVKPEIRDFIREKAAEVLALPDVRKKYAALGTTAIPSTESDAIDYLKRERTRWGKVINSIGMKAQ
ncbi:MAG: Bug family tripartite tricarboxylate transporter substrate binding protein [Pseudorhodoplanes sp.]|uniref:Bug family tripartite tricarboxylate transporter substrate binding protein n=1 Tax=Pseudorhodoplanes sp. TaxID=1934341 RepID=UPI003D0DAB6F